MNNPLISIIIPHFNRPVMLSKLLDTIPVNSYMEVLVIDDHSTEALDFFQSCKQKYRNRNIKFYETPKDKKGAGAARNYGLTLAKGKYLLFADSDDWFLPGWDTAVLNTLESNADIIFFPPISQTIDGKTSWRHRHFAKLIHLYLSSPTYEHELQLRYLYCAPCSKLIKRSLVEKNHIFFDETPYSEDMIFAGKIGLYANKIQASDKIIYCLLEHKGCNTADMNKYAIVYRQKMNNKYYLFLKKNVNRKDMKYLYFPYKNDLDWIISILSIFRYELKNGYMDVGNSTKLLSQLLFKICQNTSRNI